jgi:cyanosortase A-associated protein
MSGQRYQYQNYDRSAILEATFRYIVNVSQSSDLAGYYKRQKRNSNTFKPVDKKNKTSSNIDHILSFQNQDSLTYATCLTPENQTRILPYNQSTSQYIVSQLLGDKLQNVIPWLVGQKPLKDDRCLWMELTLTPLNAEVASEIQPLWQYFLDYWMGHYPAS